jgi:XTP/dITP diphosphohydrolase
MAVKKRIIYLASKNQHKLTELRAMIKLDHVEVRLATDLSATVTWDETGTTFEENVRIKAHAVKALAPPGVECCFLADDSGLCVDALNGAPGVYSSSYAGVEGDDQGNNAKLLRELANVPPEKRQAKFVCNLLFIDELGKETLFIGECRGHILAAPAGKSGFGYDPLFYFPEKNKSFADLGPAEKNAVSHRASAVGKFIEHLVQ